MASWSAREIHYFALDLFDERYACYRLAARDLCWRLCIETPLIHRW
jgi:hypothetical protein